jgi:transcription-repair coupling factor (superfamily II helicase)
MEAELTDRFGPPPPEVVNLLYVVGVKILCLRAGVSAISQEEGNLVLLYEAAAGMDRRALQRRLGPGVRVGSRQIWLPPAEGDEWQEPLSRILRRLVAVVEQPEA